MKSIARVERTFPLVEVSGDAFQMGYQHGQQAGHLIQRYLLWIEKLTVQPRDVLCHNAMRFLPLMETLSPAFVEEVRGLADGAGISLEEAVLCQARAEASHSWEGGCTAFALKGDATTDGQPLAGQNQDLPPEFSDMAILLRVHPTDGRPQALMYTFAGQLGYVGMNQYGVAHFANSLYDFQWRPGMPHYPLKRVMLEKRTVAECVALLQTHRTCSAVNVVLCDGQGNIADVEVRPEGIALFDDEHPDFRLHANHYVTKEFAPFETNSLSDSCPRLDRIRELVKQAWGSINVDTLKEILSDHQGDPAGICRHGASSMRSTSGYIAEPAKGLLHVRHGHGCTGTWHAYQV